MTKPDGENTEASDNRLDSETVESQKINRKFECQKIGQQNIEGKQLLRKKCETEKTKWDLLKMAEALKENERYFKTRSNKNRLRKRKKMVAESKKKRVLNHSTKYKKTFKSLELKDED